MPGGRDGKAVRSLMNEIQMLFHEHEVNERRARSGRPAINSLWIWGFGSVARPGPLDLPPLVTDDPWLEGLWRLHGTTASPIAADTAGEGMPVLTAWTRPPAHAADAALSAADASLAGALRAVIRRGSHSRLEIHTGERLIELDSLSRWRFWRRPATVQA
jgi:hypothetical protein